MRTTTKVILIFLAVFIVGGGIILFFAYQGRLGRGLELQLSVPEKVLIGVPFDLKVNASNSSSNLLEDVRLTVSLPEGITFLGSPISKSVDFRDLKTLGGGSLSQQIFRLIALSGESSFKRISADVAYISGSLSSRFKKESSVDLAIGGYGIELDIATPQKVFSGENFDTEISYKNVSDVDFNDLKLKIDYPLTYKLVKSNLPPDVGNNVWILGGLRPNSENQFKITGNIVGPEGAPFDIKASIQANFLGQPYDISVNAAKISIATSPLSLKISLNGDSDFIARPGDILNYTLNFSNNTDVGLRDVIIKAQLVGSMFDLSTLQSTGIFRSTDNTLTWNASIIPQLETISPGQSGSVTFILKAKNSYPIKRLSDKNFLLKVVGTIESPTVPHFVAADKTFSLTSLETKVAGQADLDTKVYFRDASSGIVNKGPFPPKVNQATQYTIHWLITNYATDIKNVEVRAFLAGNVRFAGVAKVIGTSAAAPVYNDRTQEIVWTIDRIPATAGVISRPIEAIFQIEATPSSADLNRFMPLIGDAALKAIDEFTDLELTDKDFGVTTQLPDDPTVSGSQGLVTQ